MYRSYAHQLMEKKVIDGCFIPLRVLKHVTQIAIKMHNSLEKQDVIYRKAIDSRLSLATSLA